MTTVPGPWQGGLLTHHHIHDPESFYPAASAGGMAAHANKDFPSDRFLLVNWSTFVMGKFDCVNQILSSWDDQTMIGSDEAQLSNCPCHPACRLCIANVASNMLTIDATWLTEAAALGAWADSAPSLGSAHASPLPEWGWLARCCICAFVLACFAAHLHLALTKSSSNADGILQNSIDALTKTMAKKMHVSHVALTEPSGIWGQPPVRVLMLRGPAPCFRAM